MRTNGRIVAVAFVVLGRSGSGLDAAIVEISLTAEITLIRDPSGEFDGQLQIGDIITGSYRYESTTPDSNPLLSVGDYEHYSAPYGISLSAGGFVFQTDPDNVYFKVGACDNHRGLDIYGIRSYNNLPLSNGVLIGHIEWQLDDSSSTALSSDALPTTPPVLDDWSYSWGLWICTGIQGGGDVAIDAEVTSVELVPEPATLLLLGLGTLLVLRSRRATKGQHKA